MEQIVGKCVCGGLLSFKMLSESPIIEVEDFNEMLEKGDFGGLLETARSGFKISCSCGNPRPTAEDLKIIHDNLNSNTEIILDSEDEE